MRVTKTPIPEFATEAEGTLFWQSHDSTDYMDWSQAKSVTFANLQPSLAEPRSAEHFVETTQAHARAAQVARQRTRYALPIADQDDSGRPSLTLLMRKTRRRRIDQ